MSDLRDIIAYSAVILPALAIVCWLLWPRKRRPDGDDVWNDARARHRVLEDAARHQ